MGWLGGGLPHLTSSRWVMSLDELVKASIERLLSRLRRGACVACAPVCPGPGFVRAVEGVLERSPGQHVHLLHLRLRCIVARKRLVPSGRLARGQGMLSNVASAGWARWSRDLSQEGRM